MPSIPTAFSGWVFARKNFGCAPETGKSLQSRVGTRKLYVDETGFCVPRPPPSLRFLGSSGNCVPGQRTQRQRGETRMNTDEHGLKKSSTQGWLLSGLNAKTPNAERLALLMCVLSPRSSARDHRRICVHPSYFPERINTDVGEQSRPVRDLEARASRTINIGNPCYPMICFMLSLSVFIRVHPCLRAFLSWPRVFVCRMIRFLYPFYHLSQPKLAR